jgi:DsbC/DsbD-like thiol-disulfide interchange protein
MLPAVTGSWFSNPAADPKGIVVSSVSMKAIAVSWLTLTLCMGLVAVRSVAANAADAKISTAHVEIIANASVATVVPGGTFTLTLDITPHPGIRVYAPGATGYKAVALTLERRPILRPRPVKYAASEIYFFKDLNERAPVYQKPFTVRQDVVLLATSEAQSALRGKDSLNLTGVLDYQACNDEVCFIPVSVPVSWTVSIGPLVKPHGAAPRSK